MNAAAAPSTPGPSGALSAELVTGRGLDGAAADVSALRLGRRVVVVSAALAEGDHAWLRVTLPGGRAIRPLVQAMAPAEGGTACRIVHLFPDDQRAFDAYHAARATPAGY